MAISSGWPWSTNRCAPPTRRRCAGSVSFCLTVPSRPSISAAGRAGTHGCCAGCCRRARGWPPAMSRRPCCHSSRPAPTATPAGWCRCCQPPKSCLHSPLRPRSVPGRRRPGPAARRPAVHLHPHPPAERADDLGPLLPRFHRARAAPAQRGRAPGRRQADQRAHADGNTDLPALAHEHGRAAPSPGRGASLLDTVPLPAGGIARSHRDLSGSPAWP